MTLPADSIYQNALRNFTRLRSSAAAAWTNKYKQDVLDRNQAFRPLNEAKPINIMNTRNDAAGRGMLQSTRTAEDITKVNNDFATQVAGVQRGFDSSQNTSTQQRDQLLASIKMQQEQARLDMIARRAAART